MSLTYLDCYSGISGDMTLGALLDLGLAQQDLEKALGTLEVSGWRLEVQKVLKTGIRATYAQVVVAEAEAGHHHHHHHSHHHEQDVHHSHEHSQAPSHSHPHDHHSHDNHSQDSYGHDAHRHHDHHGDHGRHQWGEHPQDSQGQSNNAHSHSHDHTHHQHHHGDHRSFQDIRRLIEKSGLPAEVREKSIEAFHRIGVVEADIHGTTLDRIHFHEVGAVDSIVDLVGAIFGFHELGLKKVASSPVAVGGGTVKAAHGIMPVPAPATVRLLKGIPLTPGPNTQSELTTPTGAALLSVLVTEGYGPLPAMAIEAVGYGAGTRDFSTHANTLRILTGQATCAPAAVASVAETLTVLSTEIDDMDGESLGFALELLREQPVLDVVLEPVQMKKGRPGQRIQVLIRPEFEFQIVKTFLRCTTTLGVRANTVKRYAADRKAVSVNTKFGPILGKKASWLGEDLRITPEYEDLRRVARQKGLTVIELAQVFHVSVAQGQVTILD